MADKTVKNEFTVEFTSKYAEKLSGELRLMNSLLTESTRILSDLGTSNTKVESSLSNLTRLIEKALSKRRAVTKKHLSEEESLVERAAKSGNSAYTEQLKMTAREAEKRWKQIDKFRQEANKAIAFNENQRLDQQRRSRVDSTLSGLTAGKVDFSNPAQLAKANTAVDNIQQSIARGKFSLAELQRAVTAANSGLNITSKLGGSQNAAVTAVNKLNAALAQAGNTAQTAGGKFRGFGNIVKNSLIFSGVYRSINGLISGVTSSITEASDYIIKINEIRSINQEAGTSFDDISRKVQQLSTAFGLPALDVAEAAYQAISNQVAKGSEAFQFLGTAAELSVASVSSLTDSTNALSSVIKSYGLESKDAARISAILFKSVELGRFRVSDIADSLGRLTSVSSSLKIPFEDIISVFATFTQRGVKVNEAFTLLNNLMIGFLKPTKEATAFFQELGFSSTEQALRVKGLVGVLDLLNKEFERNPERVAKIANDMREFRAVALSTGLAIKDFTATINANKNAGESYREAIRINLENSGRDFKKYAENVEVAWRKFGVFVVDITQYIVNGLATLTPALARAQIGKTLENIAKANSDLTLTFQKQDSEASDAVENLGRKIRDNLAENAKAAGRELSSVNNLIADSKVSVADKGALFFESLTDKLKATTEEATRAKNVLDSLKGSNQAQGVIADVQRARRTALDRLSFEEPGRDVNLVKFRVLRQQLSELLTVRQELAKLPDRKVLGEDGNINTIPGGRIAKTVSSLAGNTPDAIKESADAALQIARELAEVETKSLGKRGSYNLLVQRTKQIYDAELTALNRIAEQQQRIFDQKTKEANIDKVRVDAAKRVIGELDKFDPTKFKKTGEAEKELSRLIGRVTEFGDLFQQDPSFNTALSTRISLMQQQLTLSRGVADANRQDGKTIEAAVASGKQRLELLKKERDSAINLAKSLAGAQVAELQKNEDRIRSSREKPNGETFDATALGDKLNNFIQTGNVTKLGQVINTLKEFQLASNKAITAPIIQQLLAAEQQFSQSIEAEDRITQVTLELNSAFKGTETALGALAPSFNPVIEQMRTSEQLGKILIGTYNALEISVRSAAAALSAVSGSRAPIAQEEPEENRFGGRTYAHGGRGSDRHLALLSRGETVINAKNSQRFRSQLAAINSGSAPSNFAHGGAVTNIGDVNVNVTTTTSVGNMGRTVGNAIRRELRRNTLKKG